MEQRQLSAEAATQLQDGISLLLSRWSGLQIAVENEFGGRDSRQKSQQLSMDLFTLLSQSKEPIYIDDLENMLDEFMLSLNTEIDDGSIEEISEKLMIMQEECSEGNFMSIERLRNAPRVSVPHIRQAASDDEDVDDEDDVSSGDGDTKMADDSSGDGDTKMAVDAPESRPNINQNDMMVPEPSPIKTAEAEDGWIVVSSRRSKGKRN